MSSTQKNPSTRIDIHMLPLDKITTRPASLGNQKLDQQQLQKVMHDIGNALGRISFYCERLRADGRSGNDIDTISAECAFCIDLIHELSANSPNSSMDNFCGRGVVDTIVALVIEGHQCLWNKKIDIELSNSKDFSPACKISENALFRCISNLIINAEQSIITQGKISVDVRKMEISTPQFCHSCQQPFRGDYVAVSITDTGVGISEHDLKNIFRPYFTSKSDGTGMGLSIIHDLLHSHAGHVRIESKQGRGSTFTLYIPATGDRYSSTTF